MKVTSGFIDKENEEEKKRYERRTEEGFIIPGEFVDKAQNIHGPVTREGLIIPGEFVDNRKSPEEKQYLLFYTAYGDDGDTYQSWLICIGRTEAYRYIKTIADSLDFNNSFIIVEGVSLEEAATIVEFMEYAKQFYDDTFDIHDYVDRDEEEDDSSQEQNITDAIFGKQVSEQQGQVSTEAINLYTSALIEGGSSNPNINAMLFEHARRNDTNDEEEINPFTNNV